MGSKFKMEKILHSTPHTGPESRPKVPRSHCRSEINIAAAAVPRKLSAASCASLENQVPARLQPLSPFMTPFPRFVYKWEEFFNSTSESTEFLHRHRLLRLCFRLYDAMSAHTLQSSVPPDAQVHRFQLTIIIIPSIQTKANMCFAFSRRFPAFFCCVRKKLAHVALRESSSRRLFLFAVRLWPRKMFYISL
jgi:hypothetical protein